MKIGFPLIVTCLVLILLNVFLLPIYLNNKNVHLKKVIQYSAIFVGVIILVLFSQIVLGMF